MHVVKSIVSLFALTLLPVLPAAAQARPLVRTHASEEWAQIAPHLPDPTLDPADKLETAADVLRARKFPEDALTYYKAAVMRGGNSSRLLKKEGVVHMELQHGLLARLCFQGAVHLDRKDAQGWNDLGAADFMLGNARQSVSEYKHAVKLDRGSAVYHSNLSLAYFENRDARNARKELLRAFALDPDILHHGTSGGYNLQVLNSTHYAEICFEMARVYAAQGDRQSVIDWLTKASERGYDVRTALSNDSLLSPYLQDDRVQVILKNQDERHNKEVARVKPPGLPAQNP